MGHKIIIVEDDRIMAKAIIKLLDAIGIFQIVHYETGAVAIDQILGEKPDLIILDYFLSDMTAIDILDKISPVMIKSKVVILTGQPDRFSSSEAFSMGISELIDKNHDWADKLGNAINRYIFHNQNRMI